jgi:pimeloyl-ACP methyl ester carboxylesterase
MTDVLTVATADGRTLAYADQGDPTGPPLFLFHGTPGSRLDRDAYDRPTRARIITIDRPGYGCSSPLPGRRLVDWPADVETVADALGIERFTVMGISGGGPHAVVCAALIPHRLRRVGVVCGLGPLDEPWSDEGTRASLVASNEMARHDPAGLLAVGEMIAAAARSTTDPAAFFAMAFDPETPPVDAAVLTEPEVQAMMFASLHEATRQGGVGFAEEMRMLAQPWGFDLGSIAVEVRLIQGTEDNQVPPSHARHLAAAIPTATLTLMPGEGHMSLAIHHSLDFGLSLLE